MGTSLCSGRFKPGLDHYRTFRIGRHGKYKFAQIVFRDLKLNVAPAAVSVGVGQGLFYELISFGRIG